MNFLFLSIIAGIHVSCYGAFKDAPYENFIARRFVREIVLVLILSITLNFLFPKELASERFYLVLALILVLSRIITEMYKQFIRLEDQSPYKIPSQVHVLKHIVQDKIIRLMLSLVMPGFIGLGLYLSQYIYHLNLPDYLKGFMIGLTAGSLTALGGSYKDGFFEGFQIRKFFRSPLVTAGVGMYIAFKSTNPFLIFFASMGFERMIVECYKGFFKANYVPGKFKTIKASYPVWLRKRYHLVPSYVLTWCVVFLLIILDI